MRLEGLLERLLVNQRLFVRLDFGAVAYEGTITKTRDGRFWVEMEDISGWAEDINELMNADELVEWSDHGQVIEYSFE